MSNTKHNEGAELKHLRLRLTATQAELMTQRDRIDNLQSFILAELVSAKRETIAAE